MPASSSLDLSFFNAALTAAARLRLEGETRLKDLAEVDPSAWPWAKWMYAVRESDMLVPPGGECPVYEGPLLVRLHPEGPHRRPG